MSQVSAMPDYEVKIPDYRAMPPDVEERADPPDYDALKKQVDALISAAKEVEATGESDEPGDISDAAGTWVNEAVHQLQELTQNLQDRLLTGRLSTKPSEVSCIIRQIAAAIDNSKNPQRDLVVEDIRKAIAAIGQ